MNYYVYVGRMLIGGGEEGRRGGGEEGRRGRRGGGVRVLVIPCMK